MYRLSACSARNLNVVLKRLGGAVVGNLITAPGARPNYREKWHGCDSLLVTRFFKHTAEAAPGHELCLIFVAVLRFIAREAMYASGAGAQWASTLLYDAGKKLIARGMWSKMEIMAFLLHLGLYFMWSGLKAEV
jgi:hypothetical protein